MTRVASDFGPSSGRSVIWPLRGDVAKSGSGQISKGICQTRANCILQCFLSGDVNLLVRAFIVYVHPIVEYCPVVWSPSLKHDIYLIEKVQCRFTKRLRGLKTYSYSGRLQYLRLTSLELRRLHLDLIFCYKINKLY